MATRGRRRYLITYDICDPKRLRQVHKTVKTYGWVMQYSVFIGDLDPIELFDLKRSLTQIIDHRQDSIAIIDVGLPNELRANSFDFLGQTPTLPTNGPLII
jgi:CRISPR-associated protein Cas2